MCFKRKHVWPRVQVLLGLALLLLLAADVSAVLLTVRTNVLGVTPDVVGYNTAHFYPGSNTRDWWRYSQVSGARIFISPSDIEAQDDNPPFGDGVNSQTSFTNRQALLRANPNSATYINWAYLTNRYENTTFTGVNEIRLNYACTELRKLGVDILVNISANETSLPITSTNDWAGKWELWQHYYFQAFYLAKNFDVHRFQMYNEPDAVATLTADAWLMRLQLASDAVQAAVSDVNTLYGKSLVPLVLAPVNAGSATSDFNGGLGGLAVTNRHVNFLGQSNAAFSVLQKYDYHQYDASGSGYASDLTSLHNLLTAAMSPEARLLTSISEFDTHTSATFDTVTTTLDSPTEYAELGDDAIGLMNGLVSEMYLFKFGQTVSGATGLPTKNGLHFCDNDTAPYNTGGITKAGEVWRLFNKACAPGRNRHTFNFTGTLDVAATYDPATQTYYLHSVNNTASSVSVTNVLTDWLIPIGNSVLIEEVSETCYGAGKTITKVSNARTVSGVQPARTVWLYTIPSRPQSAEQIFNATDDAQATDGVNKSLNYGTNQLMLVRNDPASTANRSVAFTKFSLPPFARTNLQLATLSLSAATIGSNATVQAYVYLLDATNWSQASLVWSNAPNLANNMAAGNIIARNFVLDAGGSAHLAGQLVVNSTNNAERLIDVTELIRAGTNSTFSFLIAQTPRWDTNQLFTVAGDTQPDGVALVSIEGGAANTNTPGPRLRVVLANSANNSPPVATGESYVTVEDTPLVVGAPGVLGNDSDPNGDLLYAVLVANPTNGVVSLNGNGSFTYTPATNYSGPDSFTYKANDGQADSATVLVSLTVTPVNDAPVAVADSAITTQNTPVVISPLANDYDVDGDSITLVSFIQGSHGSVSNSGGGVLTYRPTTGYTGSDSFNYTITDGQGGTNSAAVTVSVLPAGAYSAWTNLTVTTEAFIRGGASANTDPDEVGTNYLMVKYNASPFDTARKAYFQFDLGALSVNANTSAVFTVNFTVANQQHVQLWALNQAYTGFTPAVTWNTAQANDTASNDLLANTAFNATPIGASVLIPTSGTTPYSFTIPSLSGLVQSNRVTLALSGVSDAANNTGGMRLQRTNATLQVLGLFVPPVSNAPAITSVEFNINGNLTLNFHGMTNRLHWIQARTNLLFGSWVSISTNTSDANGNWSYIDVGLSNRLQRFYRAVLP